MVVMTVSWLESPRRLRVRHHITNVDFGSPPPPHAGPFCSLASGHGLYHRTHTVGTSGPHPRTDPAGLRPAIIRCGLARLRAAAEGAGPGGRTSSRRGARGPAVPEPRALDPCAARPLSRTRGWSDAAPSVRPRCSPRAPADHDTLNIVQTWHLGWGRRCY